MGARDGQNPEPNCVNPKEVPVRKFLSAALTVLLTLSVLACLILAVSADTIGPIN